MPPGRPQTGSGPKVDPIAGVSSGSFLFFFSFPGACCVYVLFDRLIFISSGGNETYNVMDALALDTTVQSISYMNQVLIILDSFTNLNATTEIELLVSIM